MRNTDIRRPPALLVIGVLMLGLTTPRAEPSGTGDNDDQANAVVVVRESQRFQGTWELVSARDNGVTRRSNRNRITIKGEDWMSGSHRFTFKVNERAFPKQIDWAQDGSVWKGIYRFEDNTMTLCVGPPGSPRPAEFETKPGDKRQLHVRKHVASRAP